jgi:hypothetical protein
MSTAEERARARASWPIVRTTLAGQRDAVGPLDAQAAWHAVLELTREAFAAAGPIPPRLPRSQWPSRLLINGVPRDRAPSAAETSATAQAPD